MIKYIVYFMIMCTVLLSCKKDKLTDKNSQTGKLYPVSFNVSSFTQTEGPIENRSGKKTLAADTSLNNLTMLAYKLFSAEGTFIKQLDVRKSNAGFGEFRDSLAIGTYSAIFVGLSYYPYNFIPDVLHLTEDYRWDPQPTPIMYKKINFTVTASGSKGNAVVLERVNAGLQIVIKDAIPAGTQSVNFGFIDAGYYNLLTQTSSMTQWSDYQSVGTLVPASAIGTTNFATKTYPYILNTTVPVSVNISSGTFSRIVHGVMFYPNKKTILTGNLYSGYPPNANDGFEVTYTSAFSADSIVTDF